MLYSVFLEMSKIRIIDDWSRQNKLVSNIIALSSCILCTVYRSDSFWEKILSWEEENKSRYVRRKFFYNLILLIFDNFDS